MSNCVRVKDMDCPSAARRLVFLLLRSRTFWRAGCVVGRDFGCFSERVTTRVAACLKPRCKSRTLRGPVQWKSVPVSSALLSGRALCFLPWQLKRPQGIFTVKIHPLLMFTLCESGAGVASNTSGVLATSRRIIWVQGGCPLLGRLKPSLWTN